MSSTHLCLLFRISWAALSGCPQNLCHPVFTRNTSFFGICKWIHPAYGSVTHRLHCTWGNAGYAPQVTPPFLPTREANRPPRFVLALFSLHLLYTSI
ncbi:hypothetical protein DFH06DRAFT_1166517 [Mycena polygramma]|nr:hypothetical protein DFH06DRAFT_1166517 [Mycena polygramma]